MSEFKRPISGNSIAFVVPEYKPGRCGVSDYSVRMAAGMQALGFRAEVLFVHSESGAEVTKSGEAMVAVKKLTSKTVESFDILAIQFVSSIFSTAARHRKPILEIKHPRIHLMIHEIWRLGTIDYKLTIKEQLVALLQRYDLFRTIKALRPKTIACSNGFYQKHLHKAGISASLSPMPGNIPLGVNAAPPAGLTPPSMFDRPNKEFIWATFGSLYCDFWNPESFFVRMRDAQDLVGRPFKWVVAGKQKDADSSTFRAAAQRHGFGEDIHFTGSAQPEAIDWILRSSDAAFTGTGRDFWQKSGGTLAAVERGLPVYFPRPSLDTTSCLDPSLYTDLEHLLRDHQVGKVYSGSHSLGKSAEILLAILER